jgi:hypothetical protein
MKLAIVHGELVEQRAEELGDEEDEVDPHFLVVLSNRVPNLEFVNEPRGCLVCRVSSHDPVFVCTCPWDHLLLSRWQVFRTVPARTAEGMCSGAAAANCELGGSSSSSSRTPLLVNPYLCTIVLRKV